MITVKTKIIVMVRFPAGEVADSTLSLGEYIIYNIHILGEYVIFFGNFNLLFAICFLQLSAWVNILHIIYLYIYWVNMFFLQFAFGDFKTWLLRRYTH